MPGHSLAGREECDAHCRAGQNLSEQGKHEQAAAEFLRAIAADDRFADAHFCLACSLLKTGKAEDAHIHFSLARDLDAQRFRADSRINATIREVAAELPMDGVWLVDFERILADKTRPKSSPPGDDFFYEHVHLRPEGNYLLAASVFRQLAVVLPERVRKKAAGPDEPIPFEDCCRRIGLTGWSRLQMEESMASMTSRPPFTQQLDHRRDQADRRAELHRLRAQYGSPAARDEAFRECQAAIQRNPGNLDLRQCYAKLLVERGDVKGAIEQWLWLLARFPETASWQINLGEVFEAGGDFLAQVASSTRPKRSDPSLCATARYHRGVALMKQDESAEAEEQFRLAFKLDPRLAKAQNNLGTLLLGRHETAEAKQAFLRTLEADPLLFSTAAISPTCWITRGS